MDSLSILVDEDAEEFATMMVTGLRDAGYDASYARDANSVSKLLSERSFDLVITDIIMPGKDGFEVIDLRRRLNPNAKIFAMSGGGKLYSAHACLQAAENAGIDAVLLKPFSLEALTKKIEETFPARRA